MSSQTVLLGGALMDLGIYPLYATVRLFGKAKDATYQGQQLDNSIDLMAMASSSTQTFKFTSRLGKHHFQSSL